MNSFNEIYILDLHGNSLKKEKCPDGSKDENVFDIQQGVAIVLFIKKQDEKKECKIYRSDIWGLRKKKNDWLLKNDIKTSNWQKLSPKSEFYLFIPRNEILLENYERYAKITEIFQLNSVGIVTARDSFAIDSDKETLKRHIRTFYDDKMPDELVRRSFNLKDKSNWKLKDAREKARKDDNWEDSIINILYRPFDIQWIFYHDEVIERSRKEVMRHMIQENLALCVGRAGQVVGLEKPWNIIFCSDHIADFNLFYRGGNVNFPLYIYPDTDNSPNHVRGTNRTMMIFEPAEAYRIKKPNINQAFIDFLTKTYTKMAKPEKIFYYIYAVLYSNTYRTKYAEFLKIDFPRIPFTKNYKLFSKMAEYGQRLVDLHLLKAVEIEPPVAKFQGKGDERVEKLKYDEKEKRTYINESQYFEGITEEVWQYQIGGYQVCNKWLKDRKKKLLSLDDIKHYCKIITSLQKTIEVQKAIDDIYPEVEKGTVEIDNR